ncbi:hypothetical protein [Daejeonella oryzae]|uniref:hypothetical protein n=1 Tax=Daejeonella oryzae TaxID=1122943 RepID=UPI00047E31DC|nr:hypothetical protein [Daejeonella oryzae]
MKNSNLYYPLWLKYSPVFVMLLKKAVNGTETLSLNKNDFETLGDRKVSDYTFNLEIKNTKVINNISGTAVARDLYDVLVNNPKTKELLQDKHYKLSLGKEYILRISII